MQRNKESFQFLQPAVEVSAREVDAPFRWRGKQWDWGVVRGIGEASMISKYAVSAFLASKTHSIFGIGEDTGSGTLYSTCSKRTNQTRRTPPSGVNPSLPSSFLDLLLFFSILLPRRFRNFRSRLLLNDHSDVDKLLAPQHYLQRCDVVIKLELFLP